MSSPLYYKPSVPVPAYHPAAPAYHPSTPAYNPSSAAEAKEGEKRQHYSMCAHRGCTVPDIETRTYTEGRWVVTARMKCSAHMPDADAEAEPKPNSELERLSKGLGVRQAKQEAVRKQFFDARRKFEETRMQQRMAEFQECYEALRDGNVGVMTTHARLHDELPNITVDETDLPPGVLADRIIEWLTGVRGLPRNTYTFLRIEPPKRLIVHFEIPRARAAEPTSEPEPAPEPEAEAEAEQEKKKKKKKRVKTAEEAEEELVELP